MTNSFATPWTVALQAPLSMGFPRQDYWSGLPFSSPGESSRPRDWTCISCITRRILYYWAIREVPKSWVHTGKLLFPLNHNNFSHNPLWLKVLCCSYKFQCPGHTQSQVRKSEVGPRPQGFLKFSRTFQYAINGGNSTLGQWFSKCGPWTSSISITLKVVRTAHSQLPFVSYFIRNWYGAK